MGNGTAGYSYLDWNAAFPAQRRLLARRGSNRRTPLTSNTYLRLSMVALSTFRVVELVIFRFKNNGPTIKALYHTLQYSVMSADRNSRVADSIALEDHILKSLDWVALIPISGPSQER